MTKNMSNLGLVLGGCMLQNYNRKLYEINVSGIVLSIFDAKNGPRQLPKANPENVRFITNFGRLGTKF